MATFCQVLRYSLRTMWKKPGFTGVIVLMLALGIGANTAIFSAVNAVLLKPLPYKDSDSLVLLTGVGVTPENLEIWQSSTALFERVATVAPAPSMILAGTAEPELVLGMYVSTEFFPLLGVEPRLGRGFLPEEDRPGANPVVIVSDGLWQRHFGSDPKVLGRGLTLDQTSYAVIGVMPPNFQFQRYRSSDVWFPVARPPYPWVQAVAGLRRGITFEQARADLGFLAREIELPRRFAGVPVLSVELLYENLVGSSRSLLIILLGVVGFVLLIACANVANLLLARATGRRKEIAIRAALGATRGRLVIDLMTEALTLFLFGGILGVVLAYWGLDLFLALSSGRMPRMHEVRIDGTVLVFSLLVTVATGTLFGLIPALRGSRPDLNQTLKQGGMKSTASAGHRRLGSVLVIGEVALTLVLLAGTGLLVRTFLVLLPVEPGFDSTNRLTFRLKLPQFRYPEVRQRETFFEQVVKRTMSLPGVEAVAAVNHLPLSGMGSVVTVSVEGALASNDGFAAQVYYRVCTPNYLRVMGMPIVRGRDLTEFDRDGAPYVAVINRTMARRYWAGQDPLGKRLMVKGGAVTMWLTVVGVVRDARIFGFRTRSYPEMFVPYDQGFSAPNMSIVVKTGSDPLKLFGVVREAVWSVDANLPVTDVQTMEQLISHSVYEQRSRMFLLAAFSVLALLLAAVGIYGVLSHSVSQRTHEIGIRMALGAQPRDILKLVVGKGMVLVLIGIGIGLAGALVLTRVLGSFLYGVSATDPATFAGVALLLAAVALVACYLPARRAAKVDPMTALRYE